MGKKTINTAVTIKTARNISKYLAHVDISVITYWPWFLEVGAFQGNGMELGVLLDDLLIEKSF